MIARVNATTTSTPGAIQRDLIGQVALVTGGGRGLGRVFAATLAAAGASVAVLARSADQLARTVADVEAVGGRALALPVDVTDQPAVDQAVAEVHHHLGPVDLLVNNAAVSGPVGPMWEVDPDEWWRAFDVNLRGVYLCCRGVLPWMVARGHGRIINVASSAGAYRWPNVAAYAVSKAAIIKLTENLAVEARRFGVQVFAIHPGLVVLGLAERALGQEVPPGSPAERVLRWMREEVAAGRSVPPERSAELVLLLATGRADPLSGRYLTVHDDVPALVERAEEIQRDGLYTLRIRE